jgi:hypothetical protein
VGTNPCSQTPRHQRVRRVQAPGRRPIRPTCRGSLRQLVQSALSGRLTPNRKANDRTRKLFNAAVFERLDVKGGRLCHEQYRPPFDGVFTVSEFEYETRVEVAGIEPTLEKVCILCSAMIYPI